MKDLISIIVPIYNVEKYLNKCVDSILNQSYKNLEIILINDGSLDNCGMICEEYAKLDERIKVIHKKNGGLSEARNYGLDIANGEYYVFIDSDDYIDKYMCEVLLKKAKEYDADLVSCNFEEVFFDNTSRINNNKMNTGEISYKSKEIIKKYFFDYTVDKNVVWNKLYKKNIFNGSEKIRFPVGIVHEDTYLIYKIYYFAKKIIFINDTLYFYLRRKDSITGKKSERNFIDICKGQIEQIRFFSNKDNDLKKMVYANTINVFYGLKKTNLSNIYMDIIYEEIIKNTNFILNNKYITWKIFIKFILIKYKLIK